MIMISLCLLMLAFFCHPFRRYDQLLARINPEDMASGGNSESLKALHELGDPSELFEKAMMIGEGIRDNMLPSDVIYWFVYL